MRETVSAFDLEQKRPQFCPDDVANQQKCSACGAGKCEPCGSVFQTTLDDYTKHDRYVGTGVTVTFERHFPGWSVTRKDAERTQYVIVNELWEAWELLEEWMTK